MSALGETMPETVADQLAAILLDGSDVTATSACSTCGQAAHVLVGGRCSGCWKNVNDEAAPPVRRIERRVA